MDSKFSSHFKREERVPWKKETYLNYNAVTFTNRYFTDVSKRSYMKGVPFTISEDPSGKLSELANENKLLHCEENVIKYYFHKEGRYVPIQSLGS